MWQKTYRMNAGPRVVPEEAIAHTDTSSTRVDCKRQWRNASNIWHNSMVRSLMQTLAVPATALVRLLRRARTAG